MRTLTYHPGPEQPTPEQRLLLMDDKSWEAFIEQCARQLKTEGLYTQVIHLGGAGDKGRDVCGYSAQLPTEGTWDLYQGKYYAGTLSPSDFAPELAKFLFCVFSNEYTRPRNYYICALKVGPRLHDYVLNPDTFKAWLLTEWKDKKGNFGTFKQPLTPELEAFVVSFPFCIIKVKTGDDGKMFGTVTSGMIADELKNQFDVSLDKKKIHLEHPIRALGDAEVELNLHPDVKGTLKVRIESLNPPPAPAPEAAAEGRKEDERGHRRPYRGDGPASKSAAAALARA